MKKMLFMLMLSISLVACNKKKIEECEENKQARIESTTKYYSDEINMYSKKISDYQLRWLNGEVSDISYFNAVDSWTKHIQQSSEICSKKIKDIEAIDCEEENKIY